MRKLLATVTLLAACTALSFAQTKPRLGILPFTGGVGGDGETIATLLSFQKDILAAFTVVPRTGAVNALVAEQQFQMSGYTDSDSIAEIGKLLNADYVVAGSIRQLGNAKLVIATVVNVETFEQLAGDYRQYQTIEEVQALLPGIAQVIIDAPRRDTSELLRLAVMPFNNASPGVNVQDAETLAQILAIEIGKTGAYAVLPRTTTIQTAMKELDYQMAYTDPDGAARLGAAINAQYVLSGDVRNLGTTNMFTAQILHATDGSILSGDYRNYRQLEDGISLMGPLARELTGQSSAADQRMAAMRQTEEERQAQAALRAQQQEAERQRGAEAWAKIHTSIVPWPSFGGWYVFQPGYPLGFRFGYKGAYAAWSIGGPGKEGYTEYGLKFSPDSYTLSDHPEAVFLNKEVTNYHIWVFGYSFNIIDRWLIIPVGAGFRKTTDYALFGQIRGHKDGKEKIWANSGDRYDPVIELGWEIMPSSFLSIFGTYRLIAFKEHSVSLGLGFLAGRL